MFSFFPGFIPDIIQVAPFVLAFAIGCAKPFHEHPLWFYIPTTVVVVLVSIGPFLQFVCSGSAPAPIAAWDAALQMTEQAYPLFGDVIDLFTSAVTGVFMYLIVMFAGALPRSPFVKKMLSIRSELSVLAGIIVMGHVARIISFPFYFLNQQFRAVWGDFAVWFMFVAAVIVGIPLTVFFVVPWITSFKRVRRRMSHATWKKVQKFAYPFMIFMVLQGMLLAIGHATYEYPFTSQTAMMRIMANPADFLTSFAKYVATAWFYTVTGIVYVVMRLRKRKSDAAKKASALEKSKTNSKEGVTNS